MTDCPHGMPSPATCWECMEEGPVAPASSRPAPPQPEGPVIEARYQSQCRSCNTGIHAGQRIVRTDHGSYVHAHHYPELDGWGVES